MIATLLVTHVSLGDALIRCACHVLNRSPARLEAFGVMPDDDPRDLLAPVAARLARLDDGSGVLILTDVYGASPANLAAHLVQPGHIEAVAGLSLPMLLRVLTYREQLPLGALVDRAIVGACDGVVRIKPLRWNLP